MWLSLPSVALAPRIVLLQHANEPSRPTGTGKLLAHDSLAPHLRFEQWSWAGRADNDEIERQVAQLDRPTLLWTSSNSDDEAAATPTADADYIIIDATWQEARKMFRKLECLQALPRVAIDSGGPSSYKLRADFGWRERFGFSADAPEPLCTAEAAAGILEQQGGDAAGGARVRELLDAFQTEYLATTVHPHPHMAQFAAEAHAQPPMARAEWGARSCRLPLRRFGDVASFYHQEGYRRKPKSRDVVFVLRRTDAEAERYLSGIVGAVRCTPTAWRDDLYLLQSLCIARARRREGLGTALVAAAAADLGGGGCYCHVAAELRPLYEAAGFRQAAAPAADAPKDVRLMWDEHTELVKKREKKSSVGELVLMTLRVGDST